MSSEVHEHTQLLVIGGGPAGYAAAFRGADLGLDVTLVTDEERLGGVCLLRGCIPGKTLLELTDLRSQVRRAQDRGLRFGDPDVDLDRLRGWEREVVDHLVSGLHGLAEGRSVRIVQARASFDGPEQVTVSRDDGTHRIRFDHAIVATGSTPMALPGMPLGGRIMDSAAALELPEIPERLLVVGGGYVGLELGSVYAALGSRITLVEVAARLMPIADQELVEPLAEELADRFEEIHLETTVTGMSEQDDQVQVDLDGADAPQQASFDRVLVAIGREPSSSGLGLETTKVELDDDGLIRVDASGRTSEETILAAGDVTGGLQLAHEAFHEGIVAAEAAGGVASEFDARAIPAVVYTDPQLAWCGWTEPEAAERGIEVDVVRFPWQASGRAATIGGGAGLTKLVHERYSGRILGVGIVGRQAESLISEGVLAVEMGAVLEDLAQAIAPHPSLSETLHEAAMLGVDRPLHAPSP